jgi:iron complex transport system permease protein
MRIRQVVLLVILLVFSILLNIVVGSTTVDLQTLWNTVSGVSNNDAVSIAIMQYRIPKTLTAILTGIALSVSGLIMQTVFRNPLADPYVLGVSSGAGLGVALAILGSSALGLSGFFGNLAVVTVALTGAAFVLVALFAVSLRIKDIMTILILGILFSSAIYAIIGVMQFFSSEYTLKAYVIWTMGSLGTVDAEQLVWLSVVVTAGFILAFFSSKHLNLMLIGEKNAQTSGMNIKLFRICVFSAACLMAGGATAFCGPIGFIGIIVPHISRMFAKTTDHKTLILYCSILGATIMLIADTIAQMPGKTGILPINSVTALTGIPVIIWIIFKNYRINSMF